MRPSGGPTVTHRVIEIEQHGDARFAITKGDANEAPDAAPFPLNGDQLVGRWYLDDWGIRLQRALQPQYVLALVGLAIALVAGSQLRRIWAPPPPVEALPAPAPGADRSPAQRRRRRLAMAAVPLTGVMTVGVAWALFRGDDQVGANLFAASDCFDPELGSVQTGETIHAVDGTVTVPITPVDPTSSFVTATVRSNDPEPVDSTVQVRLAAGGTAVELERATDEAVPPPVPVAWSVVEYACGVSVQHGVATGEGDTSIDVTVADAPPGQSFVLASSIDAATGTDFGGDDLVRADLSSSTNLAIRSGVALPSSRTIAWQVVTFDDPGDIAVQRPTGTLTGTSLTLTLATPADPRTTFVLASATSPSTGGADIGARAIRAHLSSPTTVEIVRQVAGEPLDVSVQVVTLREGSTVRHGTVDLGVNEPVATVSIDPVDMARATAMSTVTMPGPVAGGSTDMTADDVVGEASATVEVTDPTTVTLTRDARTAAASFGWQVIEWAGPTWWDTDYLFRQRIDVETGSAAAPGGYTVPVTLDHAALVANGIARADGTDVRVLRWDGANWTELDRILDDGASWGDASTTLLFRTDVAIDVAAVDSYWLYYGNPAAPAPPEDPEAVFALFEDFESGTLGDFEDRTAGTAWYQADPGPTVAVSRSGSAGRVRITTTSSSSSSCPTLRSAQLHDPTGPTSVSPQRTGPRCSRTRSRRGSRHVHAHCLGGRSDPDGCDRDGPLSLRRGSRRSRRPRRPGDMDSCRRQRSGISRRSGRSGAVVDDSGGRSLDVRPVGRCQPARQSTASPVGTRARRRRRPTRRPGRGGRCGGRVTVSAWVRPDGSPPTLPRQSGRHRPGARRTWLERTSPTTATCGPVSSSTARRWRPWVRRSQPAAGTTSQPSTTATR